MRGHDFSGLLDFLCGGILSRREREAVRAELDDHLQEKYETLLRSGLDEAAAAAEAEASLGSRTELKAQLSALHPYAPRISLKKAMQLLIVGFSLNTLYVELFPGMRHIFSFAGGLIMLTGLYCLAKANKPLKSAFVFRLCGLGAATANYAFEPFLEGASVFGVLAGLPAILFYTVSWVFMFRGLRSLSDPFASQAEKPLRFSPVACLWAVGNTFLPLLLLFYTGKNTDTFPMQAGLSFFAVPGFGLIAVYFICTIQLFLRLNRLLYRADHDYDIEDNTKVKIGFCAAAAVFALGIVFAGHFLYVKQPPKTAVYGARDVGISDAERAALVKELCDSGLPEELASVLPESELIRYRTLQPPDEDAALPPADAFSSMGKNDVTVTEYVFPLTGENGEACFRFVRHIRLLQSERLRGGYRLERPPADGLIPLSDSELLLILRRQDGRVYEDAPLKEFRDTLGMLTGFDFMRGEHTDIVFAVTYAANLLPQNAQFTHSVPLCRSLLPDVRRTLDEYVQDPPTAEWNVETFRFVTSEYIK